MMTNLLDAERFPAALFGDLYHQRWRIEEAFKRLKHRLNLEHVTGLSQQAVMHDLAAKVLCDNLQAHQSRLCPLATQTAPALVAAWVGSSSPTRRRACADCQANVSTSPGAIKITSKRMLTSPINT
jgi:Transposase DDE domain